MPKTLILLLLLFCCFLSGCIPSYEFTLINQSETSVTILTPKGDAYVPKRTESNPFHIPYFGAGKENWILVRVVNCEYSYPSPHLKSALKEKRRLVDPGKRLTLILDQDYLLHLSIKYSTADQSERGRFDFPMAPKIRCSNQP